MAFSHGQWSKYHFSGIHVLFGAENELLKAFLGSKYQLRSTGLCDARDLPPMLLLPGSPGRDQGFVHLTGRWHTLLCPKTKASPAPMRPAAQALVSVARTKPSPVPFHSVCDPHGQPLHMAPLPNPSALWNNPYSQTGEIQAGEVEFKVAENSTRCPGSENSHHS